MDFDFIGCMHDHLGFYAHVSVNKFALKMYKEMRIFLLVMFLKWDLTIALLACEGRMDPLVLFHEYLA